MLGKEVVAFWWFADSPVILLQCRMSQHNNVTIYFSLSLQDTLLNSETWTLM